MREVLRVSDLSKETNRVSNVVIGAALAVHRALGPGFLESVYEEALRVELRLRGESFARQVPVRIEYRGHVVGEARLDLLVCDKIIVELKAFEAILPVHHAQVVSYLRATGCQLGLLINFNVPILSGGIKRIVLS